MTSCPHASKACAPNAAIAASMEAAATANVGGVLCKEMMNTAKKQALKTATENEILHELTQIALGERTFSCYEKSSGDIIQMPPSESACMKALELLGKSMHIFSDKATDEADNTLQVEIDIIGGDKR